MVRILYVCDTEDMLSKDKDFTTIENHKKILEIWFFKDFYGWWRRS